MAATETPMNSRRKILYHAVALAVQETGYNQADKVALETLTEMLQSLLIEMGRSTRMFAELAGRVEPTTGDLVLAMTDMGLKVQPAGLRNFSRRHSRPIIPNPSALPPPKVPTILSAGKRRSLPAYIPDYFPPMPDSHAYIRTPTHKQPLTDYAACREKTSQQKRDLERSLSKFYARTSPCFGLFPEISMFPLIAPKPIAYLDPLVPRDQIFEEGDGDAPLNYIKKEKPIESKLNDDMEDESGNESSQDASSAMNTSWELIDNPFLRPVKMFAKPAKK